MKAKAFSQNLPAGGGWYLLGVQSLAAVCIVFWAVSSTFLLLWLVNKVTPLRMDPKDEILGADFTEHNIVQRSECGGHCQPAKSLATTTNSSISETQISQRPRTLQSDERMAGIYKTYFTDDLATDRSKPPARDNPAYQPDAEGV